MHAGDFSDNFFQTYKDFLTCSELRSINLIKAYPFLYLKRNCLTYCTDQVRGNIFFCLINMKKMNIHPGFAVNFISDK